MTLPIGVQTNRTTRLDCWRNKVAGRLANAVLGIATEDYRSFIAGSIRYGLAAAIRDAEQEGDA